MDCGFMHGETPEITRNRAYFRPFRLVEILHSSDPGARACRGFSLPEVLVALVVLGVGLLGVAAIGRAGRQLAEVAAVRTAQAVAAHEILTPSGTRSGSLEGGAIEIGARLLGVTIDTVVVSSRVLELRLTVDGSGAVGALEVVTRSFAGSP